MENMYFLKSLKDSSLAFPLTEFLNLGKDPSCQIQIHDSGVEDRHARIELKDGKITVKDLRSKSGTFINDAQIIESYAHAGDILRFGSHEWTVANLATPQTKALTSRNDYWNRKLSQLLQASRTDYPILLLGPSGTGKDIISQNIHENSLRRSGNFVSVNCSALTETLIESELFGHIKGSFTGAIADRKGAFESARGGTLFLDEIGDLPYGLQAKLLRALENNEIRPVGSDKTVKTDVRIIAATHQNLGEKIAEGAFRADLFYRLNVVTICTPALRDRMEDFDDLFYTFAKQMRVRFSFGAIAKLKQHVWPGNIRELKNLVTRASALFPQMLIEDTQVSELVDNVTTYQGGIMAESQETMNTLPVIKEIEKQMIIKRLTANKGNQRRTANDLGMPKSTLHDRIRTYGIDLEQFKS